MQFSLPVGALQLCAFAARFSGINGTYISSYKFISFPKLAIYCFIMFNDA